jgi:hypothetical protein
VIGAGGLRTLPICAAHQSIDEVFHSVPFTEILPPGQSGLCAARLILRLREIA